MKPLLTFAFWAAIGSGLSGGIATLAIACSQVTATDRAKTAAIAIDTLDAICPSYMTGKSGIPETPELTAVCATLLREPVVVVSEVPAPVDAGTEGG